MRQLLGFCLYRTGLTSALHLALRSKSSPYTILMYHRVVDPERLLFPIEPGMYVRPTTFARQMQFLARATNVLPLAELIELILSEKSLPARAVAITFDDGWRDNYEFAFPILRTLHLPATVFLPTAYINTSRRFPYDMIARLQKPVSSGFAFNGENLSREIARLKALSRTKREEELDLLLRSQNPDAELAQDFITWDQAREMESSGISFASHSHEHQLYPELSQEELEQDLSISLKILGEQLNAPLPLFCFPNGSVSTAALPVLKLAGIRAALTTSRTSDFSKPLPLIGRLGVHQDISSTTSLFANRVFGIL